MFTRSANNCWPAAMIEPEDKQWMRDLYGPRVKFNAPLAGYTSFRLGGPADVLVEPLNQGELKAIVLWAGQTKTPYLVLGGGTNVLVKDGGVRGLVIAMGPHWSDLKWHRQGERIRVSASAGTPTRRICRLALKHGWDGVNFALGIPGTLGGAILMNAGTRSGCMAEILHSATIMTAEGEAVTIDREAIDAGYRRILLPAHLCGSPDAPSVLVSAALSLRTGDSGQIRSQAVAMMRSRASRQPTWKPSAGCVFKNPSGEMPAGRLIESAGLKGKMIGGAQISSRHANFIVNAGGATARDVLSLISEIKNEVLVRHGVSLELEVRIVGQEKKDNAKKSP